MDAYALVLQISCKTAGGFIGIVFWNYAQIGQRAAISRLLMCDCVIGWQLSHQSRQTVPSAVGSVELFRKVLVLIAAFVRSEWLIHFFVLNSAHTCKPGELNNREDFENMKWGSGWSYPWKTWDSRTVSSVNCSKMCQFSLFILSLRKSNLFPLHVSVCLSLRGGWWDCMPYTARNRLWELQIVINQEKTRVSWEI